MDNLDGIKQAMQPTILERLQHEKALKKAIRRQRHQKNLLKNELMAEEIARKRKAIARKKAKAAKLARRRNRK